MRDISRRVQRIFVCLQREISGINQQAGKIGVRFLRIIVYAKVEKRMENGIDLSVIGHRNCKVDVGWVAGQWRE